MSKTILTYHPYIEMVSLNPHMVIIIVNELLILVIRVTAISFIVATFVTYEKVLVK